jgi:hypothetical protein
LRDLKTRQLKKMIMQRVVLDIPDKKINFFMELVNNLGFKKVRRLSKEQKEFVDDLNDSLNEVELHRQGKVKLQSARDFLNEL